MLLLNRECGNNTKASDGAAIIIDVATVARERRLAAAIVSCIVIHTILPDLCILVLQKNAGTFNEAHVPATMTNQNALTMAMASARRRPSDDWY